MTLQGAFTAMVTPFREGKVDHDRLAANVEEQIEAGIDGLVPVGTTGESPTLSHDEHRAVIETVVSAATGRVPIVAGTGSNSTAEAMELTGHAASVGAAAALMVNPYYNKPSQEGLYRHFMAVADACDIDIVLYNIPGRTNVTMTPETVERLAGHERIVAIKEATGSLDIASEIALRCGDRVTILSGDDSLTLPLMSIGGRGVISVLSNLMPAQVCGLAHAGLDGRWDDARRRHLELFKLCKGLLTLATNPIPIKAALKLVGKDTGELRLPLCEMDAGCGGKLEALLKDAGLLEPASA